jgi:hypothetical protein
MFIDRKNPFQTMYTAHINPNTDPAGDPTTTISTQSHSQHIEHRHLFMFNREEFMAHYHKRSNAESVFSMVKGKFGDSVRSKSDVGQINEVLAKMLCHNMCVLIRATHELGVEPIFGSGSGIEPKLFI